jgi:hypothetical protein
MPDGTAQLDISPDGSPWRWTIVPAAIARVDLAVGIAAISGGWKLYVSLPDDHTSNALEIIGLSKTRDLSDSTNSPGFVFQVSISPTPRLGTPLSYTVMVTDASNTPVDQATVSLHNYVAGADDIHTKNTVGGIAIFANITLSYLTLGFQPPNLTVSKDSFVTYSKDLFS